MFRITYYNDDHHHPMHGAVMSVASVAEALAEMSDVSADDVADEYGGEFGDVLADLPTGCRMMFPGDMCNYLVERI